MCERELRNSLATESNKLVYSFFAAPELDPFFSEERHSVIRVGEPSMKFTKNLLDVFNIPEECRELFKAKKRQAKDWRINQINSSALTPLLFFYKPEIEPLSIKVKSRGETYTLVFNKSVFEKPNPVYGTDSKIDVALYGKVEENGRDCVLFLESKFSEYLKSEDDTSRSNKYWDGDGGMGDGALQIVNNYANSMHLLNDLSFGIDKKLNRSFVKSKYGRHYCQGISQMIAHNYGALRSDELSDNYMVFLGTVLFDFDKGSANLSVSDDYRAECKALIDDYRRVYRELAIVLNTINDSRDVYVVDEVLTHQEILIGYKLDDEVKEFYSL